MSLLIDRRSILCGLTALALARPVIAQASTHDIQMLNTHPENRRLRYVFLPDFMQLQVGDTVRFLAIDKGHNAESIRGMMPSGAERWRGRINQEIEVTFEIPGVYGVKCQPHYALGMVSLIVVQGNGMLNNLSAAKKVRHPGRARKTFEELWAKAEASGLLG